MKKLRKKSHASVPLNTAPTVSVSVISCAGCRFDLPLVLSSDGSTYQFLTPPQEEDYSRHHHHVAAENPAARRKAPNVVIQGGQRANLVTTRL